MKAQNAQGCEDWELHLRIAEHDQFKVVPEFLVGYRQITSSMSCNFAAMAKCQALIMADVRPRHPEIAASIDRWSNSNFYIDLAVKSNQISNHRSTLFWLIRAFKEDLFMAILRHNLYILSIESILKIILLSASKSPGLESPKIPNEVTIIAAIETRMKVHRMLPSQMYERMRFNSLANRECK